MLDELTFIQPDDWHIHLRDGAFLARTVPDAAKQFARAIVMPNLKEPVTTVAKAAQYRNRILKAIPAGHNFQPLMTLYLTDQTTQANIREAGACDFVYACKLYPANATTLSASGVNSIQALYPIFEAMQAADLPLLIHGETTNQATDIFDREAIFIDEHLAPLIKHFPDLRVVLEHISTKTGVDFVMDGPNNLAATITAHHLLMNRNDLLSGGIRPHYYCLPVLKRNTDQEALIKAATSGNPKFFLGTDSAPHAQANKETACGCAGVYTAHAAIELYLEVFDAANRLAQFNDFASVHGPGFYRLPVNTNTVTYRRQNWTVPPCLSFGKQQLIPLRGGDVIQWSNTKSSQ